MAPPKRKKRKQVYTAPVYNNICFLADPKSPPSRCDNNRLHYYIEAWLGYEDLGEEYYEFVYKRKSKQKEYVSLKKNFTSVGSVDSFEGLLRKLNIELSKTGNKGKKIGDLIILTHGREYYDQATKKTETVKIMLPLFSFKNPDGSGRSLPDWWDKTSTLIDAEEIEKLQKKGSDYYNYVDGKDTKNGLMTVVVKNIVNYLDSSTHIWFVGCSLGLNKILMQAVRKLFANKPTIFGFNKKHIIYYYWKDDVSNCTRCWELVKERDKKAIMLWTKKGMNSVVQVP